jgi:PPIC-type PPIASE domain
MLGSGKTGDFKMKTGRQVTLSMMIVLCIAGSSLWAKAEKTTPAKPDDTKKDTSTANIADDDVIISVNGKELKKWELDALIAHKSAMTPEKAADSWVDIQLRAEEAKKRGLDKGRGAGFLMQLHKDFYLGLSLGRAVLNEMPEITEQQARKRYERDIKQYDRPFKATLQHVTIKDEQQAKKAAEEARAPGAIFNNICSKYSIRKQSKDGRMTKATHERLLNHLGPEMTQAIESFDKKLLTGDNIDKSVRILGPFPDKDGFELVRLISITEAYTISFDKSKEKIMGRLKAKKRSTHKKGVMDKLKADAEIVRTDALLKLEELDKSTRPQIPPRPRSPDLKPRKTE